MFIVGKQGWYYDGCMKCTKKFEVKDGPFTCKCETYNQRSTQGKTVSVYRYKLDIKVIHLNGSGRFVFGDRQCADIIGIPASELRNQMLAEGEDDPKAFLLILDTLLARTMALRVKVQSSYNQSSVIRLSENPILIKTIVDQFGILESVSVTADHDPDNLQVVTPAKRMSDDLDLDLLQSPLYKSTQLSSSKVTKHIKTE
ncbi:PREDICTED: uncharacterized protein LOC109359788 [Lupinus angustifolius]|uniref:uncharacterized protein LOC109359788 n=1 Tax=Lupinus angustifolius TaxID=3871 RepID=UPI00092E2F62|nr:PREDICTED: uncharacterized protein LOC109359788 [Lupinus angustifolius]